MQSLPGYDAWLEYPYQQYHDSDDRYTEIIASLNTMTVTEVEALDDGIATTMYPAWDKAGVQDDEAKAAYAHIKWPTFLSYWNPSKEEMGAIEHAIDWWADKTIEKEEEERLNGPY